MTLVDDRKNYSFCISSFTLRIVIYIYIYTQNNQLHVLPDISYHHVLQELIEDIESSRPFSCTGGELPWKMVMSGKLVCLTISLIGEWWFHLESCGHLGATWMGLQWFTTFILTFGRAIAHNWRPKSMTFLLGNSPCSWLPQTVYTSTVTICQAKPFVWGWMHACVRSSCLLVNPAKLVFCFIETQPSQRWFRQ